MDYKPLEGAAGTTGLSRGVDLLLGQKQPRSLRTHERGSRDPRELQFVLQYLDAFGYLTRPLADWDKIELRDITGALKRFQDFFGLEKNGVVCSKTVRAMEAPRCGCPDIERAHHTQYKALLRWARSMLAAWRKRSLTYVVTDYVPGIATADQDHVHAAAFAAWTQLGNIDAQKVTDPAHADIILSTGEGPRSNFDGPGGTLAWAYLPDGNDQQLLMKFDLSETWTLGAGPGTIMLNVATHEFGHLLGLSHSVVPTALMAPYYKANVATPQQNDDIPRLTARYGVRAETAAPAPSESRTKIAIEGDVCVWLNQKQLV